MLREFDFLCGTVFPPRAVKLASAALGVIPEARA